MKEEEYLMDYLTEPKDDIKQAEEHYCEYDDNYPIGDPKVKMFGDCLIAIAKLMEQIRDELRKMNEGSDEDGNT